MKRDLRNQARLLRAQGFSVNEIVKTTGASKGSVSLWVRDIELTEDQIAALKTKQRTSPAYFAGGEANQRKHLDLRLAYQQKGRTKAKEGRPLHLAGCMLYWAEGAKSRNGVYFVNSDPNMIVIFMRFLREEMGIKDTEVALRIHCHTDRIDEIRRIEQYWADLLLLPPSCVKKTYIKQSGSNKHRVLANGVCDIRVHRTEIVQHIFGAIQEYGGFENPDWLF